MTVNDLTSELRQLDPDPGLPVAVDGNVNVEISIVYDAGGTFLNIGIRSEE